MAAKWMEQDLIRIRQGHATRLRTMAAILAREKKALYFELDSLSYHITMTREATEPSGVDMIQH
jgi:hypothetical protein